jgi:two-component system LytT family response regulator
VLTRYLVFDSNPSERAALRLRLAAYPGMVCAGEAATPTEARHLLASVAYELVFLDTELAGRPTFELLPDLNPEARFVFVTRTQLHVIRAFEVNALDYLLKPVPAARLANTLRRVDPAPTPSRPPFDPSEAPFDSASKRLSPDDVLRVRTGHGFRFAPVRQIVRIQAQDNYSEVQLLSGPRALIRRTMKFWEQALPEDLFLRVHRTQIVNLSHLTTCRRNRRGHTLIGLDGLSTPLTASRHRWTEIRNRLKIS